MYDSLYIGLAHAILVSITFAKKTPLSAHIQVNSGARGLNLDLHHYLH